MHLPHYYGFKNLINLIELYMMELNLDLNEILSLDKFTGEVPVFPLSNVVLFPYVLLPLHIFEDRYKKMLHDSLSGEKLITMALLKPGWEKNYYDNPDVYDISCLGRVISTEYFEDGRANVILYGLKRVQIMKFLESTHYRLAEVSLINEMSDGTDELYRKHIEDLLLEWNQSMKEDQKAHRIEINTSLSLDKLTDTLTTLIITNVFDRQQLLEEINPVKRAEIIIKCLETRLELIKLTSKISRRIPKTRNLN